MRLKRVCGVLSHIAPMHVWSDKLVQRTQHLRYDALVLRTGLCVHNLYLHLVDALLTTHHDAVVTSDAVFVAA